MLFWLKIQSPKTPFLAGLKTIDWVGTLTIVGGTLMFLFGLEFGGVTYPWKSATVICLIVFGVVVLGLFVVHERKFAKYPIIPISIFEDWSNIFILLTNWAHGTAFIAGSYYMPLYFQTVLSATPILSGVYILPQVGALSVLSLFAGFLIRKTGRYFEIIVLSMVVMTLGYGLYIDLKPYASWPRIIIYQIIAGTGIGPNFQAPLIALQSGVRPSEVAAATSTFGFVRQLSTSISIVLGGVIYQNVMRKSASASDSQLRDVLGPELAQKFSETFSGSSMSLLGSLNERQRRAIQETYTYALSRNWIFYTCVTAVGCIFTLFIRKRELSRQHNITKTGLEEQERARQERMEEKEEEKKKKKRAKDEKKEGEANGGGNAV